MTLIAGCDKDDDGIRVDRAMEEAFRSRYPGVTHVEWERNNDYYVADFRQNGTEAEAWYDRQAIWCMTETDLRYADLPQAVGTAFEESDYSRWRIDDIDMLEYPDRETVYILEVEQGNAECDLYFTVDGVMVKALAAGIGNGSGNNGETHQPSGLLSAIKDFIAEKYPQARIVDVDTERNSIEVDIVDGRTPREAVFSPTGEWTYTETKVRQADLPQAVLDTVRASQYGSWRIDDIDHYAAPTGEYYRLELESGDREMHLKIAADGSTLP